MKTYTAGLDITLAVPFTRGGEPFVPDSDSVVWALRDTSGAVVLSAQPMYDVSDTVAQLIVPAVRNSVSVVREFEKRFVTVTGTESGSPFEINLTYRLVPWINTTVTPEEVRTFIGVDSEALPDDAIDIVHAYLTAQTTVLDAALSSGTSVELKANKVILGQTVLDVLPSLRLRMVKSADDGNIKFERFAIDWAALEAAATALVIGLDVVDTSATAFPLFILGTPSPDPVTGA